MRQHFDDHPWLGDVYEALPDMRVSSAILAASRLGLMDCWKFGRCEYAEAYQIRCQYQPWLMAYWDDPPDDAHDVESLKELQHMLRSNGV